MHLPEGFRALCMIKAICKGNIIYLIIEVNRNVFASVLLNNTDASINQASHNYIICNTF